ncbi:MAG: glycosyltransferase family 87 protein [bacterium]
MEKLNAFFWSSKSETYAKRLWFGIFTLMALLVFLQPTARTVTENYSRASYCWWRSENMYSLQGKGFLYFPQSVLIYTPFCWQEFPKDLKKFNKQPLRETLLPTLVLRLGEVFYRAFSLGLFGWAIWRMCRLFQADVAKGSLFCLVTVLALPASLTSARNGQFNMLLSAAMILAAVCVSEKRWWPATAWLVLGVMAKPLGLVPLLLFGALHRPLWWRLPLGMLVFGGLSFLHYDPNYVLHQWRLCIQQITVASIPPGNHYDDIVGMFRAFGCDVPDKKWFPVRAIFAFLTLGIAWRLKKSHTAGLAPFLVMAFAAAYLMLFNPRTEACSYIIVAPYVALFAAILFREKGAKLLFWLLVFIGLGLGSDSYGGVYHLTRIWFKPLIVSVFFIILNIWVFRKASSHVSLLDRNLLL